MFSKMINEMWAALTLLTWGGWAVPCQGDPTCRVA